MSLDEAVFNGKEHRKPYKGAKAVDHTCRNHEDRDYCKGNRLYSVNKALEKTEQMMKEMHI